MRFLLAATLLLTGCATTLRGFLDPGPPVSVRTLDGQAHKLLLTGDASVLKYLNEHTVEVSGPKAFGRVKVREWQILEGRNGLPVWVGVLEVRGIQLGMHDHNSGAYYLFNEGANDVLWPHVGQPVLVEGYVDGAHQVEVVYFRVLTDDG